MAIHAGKSKSYSLAGQARGLPSGRVVDGLSDDPRMPGLEMTTQPFGRP